MAQPGPSAALCASRVHTSFIGFPVDPTAVFLVWRCEGFSFFFFLRWHVLCVGSVVLSRSILPGSASLLIDVVRSPCLHSGRRLKPRQARDGHSWRMAAALLVLPAGPSSLLPTFTGGVWKAGVRLSGLSPVKGPPHSSLWFVGVPVRRAGGASLFPVARFATTTVCVVRLALLPPSRGRVG